MTAPASPDRQSRKNQRLAWVLLGIFVGMVGLSFAAVPLYDLFCRVTGIAGTTQVSEAAPGAVGEQRVTIRFNADVNQRLPWRFEPEVRSMEVRIGEPNLAFYHAKNLSSRPTVGMAVYNVSPFQAGAYFHKVQCFCFDEQVLQPGQQVDMPVYFYVDPSLADDPGMDDVKTITLSYTFFPAGSEELDGAKEDYYRAVEQANAPVAEVTKGPDTAVLAR